MLAIVIPFYKLTFFEATLQSLANQTDKRFKVYIGDDASPEDCTSLLKQFEGQFDFTYHRFETNLGGTSLTQQWERCIALSEEEEWLMILGDDDLLGENVVEEFYKNKGLVDSENSNVLKFATVNIDDKGIVISKKYMHPLKENVATAYYRKFIWESRSSLSEYIFRRTSYIKHGFENYPLAWHADDRAWFDFSEGGNICCSNEAIIYFRLTNFNISGQTDNEQIKKQASKLFFYDLITKYLNLFTRKQQSDILFEFGILIKELDEISLKNIVLVTFKFLKRGSIYDLLRFWRRMYLAKFNFK
ncbi:glycosyltransferase family 2 protein [Flavobacterium luminosum]|uniref:Glycosyltransferase family 2 protein n=1 Tax=Flavobacterium luminosum TaxID=2949086 RepID=A0ABT0TNL5_9FLAO|nr:glycosyltransferase family 2 protein [Flavobacterium sp. HXWNR70]MCL9809094.1 glycosyltransferase family 2 protein [Flavobacterium sp. HXWNR70]